MITIMLIFALRKYRKLAFKLHNVVLPFGSYLFTPKKKQKKQSTWCYHSVHIFSHQKKTKQTKQTISFPEMFLVLQKSVWK